MAAIPMTPSKPQQRGATGAPPPAPTPGGGNYPTIIADRFKTRRCRNFDQTRNCPYGFRCMFAHGDHEIRTSQQNIAAGLVTEAAVREYVANLPPPVDAFAQPALDEAGPRVRVPSRDPHALRPMPPRYPVSESPSEDSEDGGFSTHAPRQAAKPGGARASMPSRAPPPYVPPQLWNAAPSPMMMMPPGMQAFAAVPPVMQMPQQQQQVILLQAVPVVQPEAAGGTGRSTPTAADSDSASSGSTSAPAPFVPQPMYVAAPTGAPLCYATPVQQHQTGIAFVAC